MKLIILTWCMFIPIAIANGLVREKLYKPIVGELYAHQISTVIASLLFIVLAYSIFKNNISTLSNRDLFNIGGTWVSMTVAFEFMFGYFIDKVTLQKLLTEYNIFEGRIWSIFLLVVFLTPIFINYLAKR